MAAAYSFRQLSTPTPKATIREHSRNIQGTFKEHSGNIQGTSMEHPRNMQGTFKATIREHSRNLRRKQNKHNESRISQPRSTGQLVNWSP
jgi:hypothetical protein